MRQLVIEALSDAGARKALAVCQKWRAGLVPGRSGNSAKREFLATAISALERQAREVYRLKLYPDSRLSARSVWLALRLERCALGLARMAGQRFDEHGSARGDQRTTAALDYVPPGPARQAPFCDLGGAGVALVVVNRRRVYRGTKWGPSWAATHYLCGRNEVGTWYAHPVPTSRTVREALAWIWGGRAEAIIARQGDIALIRGAGPKLPALPLGHRVHDGSVVHATHPPLRLPGTGERIIVGRRAAVRVSAATRD